MNPQVWALHTIDEGTFIERFGPWLLADLLSIRQKRITFSR